MTIRKIINNPTKEQRHEMLYESLSLVGRTEDYNNIVELLSPPPDILQFASSNSLKDLNIGIIGCGLAGLVTAFELRKLGANITIFDADNRRIGGRIYTYYFNNNRTYFGEFGAMRIPVSHETTWYYINLFNLNTETLIPYSSNEFLYVNNIRMRTDRTSENIERYLYPLYNLTEAERNTPWNELIDYANNSLMNELTPEERSEILKILPKYSNAYTELVNLSNKEVYERLGLSQGFINLASAVNPFTASSLNLSYNETMTGSYSLDFLNTYRISNGMVNLPLAFVNSLLNNNTSASEKLGNVNIRVGHRVTGLSQMSNGSVNIKYVNPYGNEKNNAFDLVVCTIPFSTLREIELNPYFSPTKMQAIRELYYTDAKKLSVYLIKDSGKKKNHMAI